MPPTLAGMFQRDDHGHSLEISSPGASGYRRIEGVSRRPQGTDFIDIVSEYYAPYVTQREKRGRDVPWYVKAAFEGVQGCGDIRLGSATFVCTDCELEVELPFSCWLRGMCPSCLGRRMRDRGEFISENIVGDTPVFHWVNTFPPPLRSYLAFEPALTSALLMQFLAIVFALVRRQARKELRKRFGKRLGKIDPGSISTFQRSSSFLDLSVHFHCVVTAGVFYRDPDTGKVAFHHVAAPTTAEIAEVAWKMCRKTCELLARRGLWKDLDDPKGITAGKSKYGRIALGTRKNSRRRDVRFTAIAAEEERDEAEQVDDADPFVVFAGDATEQGDRGAVRRLIEYILAPPFKYEQVSRGEGGKIRFQPKKPRRDGKTHRMIDPLNFMHILATLVPRPRLHTTRFHGVYARRHKFRDEVVQSAKSAKAPAESESEGGAYGDLKIALAEVSRRMWPDDVRCPECRKPMLLKKMVTENMNYENGRRTPRDGTDPP